jgi:poly(3-hydroxybutyrate) depolymerase
MNRHLYSFAIFFAVLYTIISVIHSLLYFQLGIQLYAQESYPAWYLCAFGIFFIGWLTLLKYYHYKKFTFAFWTALISIIAIMLQAMVVYSVLMGVREMIVLYVPVILLAIGGSMLAGASLLFSPAGERPWLKVAGIVALVQGLVLAATIMWSMSPPDLQKNFLTEKIHQWTALVSSFVPLLFVMNFLNELKLLKKQSVESPPPPQPRIESYTMIVGAMAVAATLFIGGRLLSDTLGKLSWDRQLAVKAKEWEKLFEARTFQDAKRNTLKYQLLKPLDYDPEKNYPMVVCLPYGGGVEGCPPAQELLTDFNRKKYPSFLFVPYCPEGAGWGGVPNYPTMDTLVFESIRALEKEVKQIDTKRLYVTGVSRGGYGSWHFISTAPEMFAAAVPVCGGGDPRYAAGITDVAVWAFHGEKDRNVPVELSRNMIEAMKKAGGNPRYTEFPGVGHNVWDNAKNTPGLWDWLFEQKRM